MVDRVLDDPVPRDRVPPELHGHPDGLRDAVRPAERSVEAFAGKLYAADADFESTSLGDGDDYSHLYCTMKYADPILRAPGPRAREAMSRKFTLSMTKGPRLGGTTTSSLLAQATTTAGGSRPERVSGIGDDAIAWVESVEDVPVQVGVRFRIGNLGVEVTTSGRDWSGQPRTMPVNDSSALRDELRAGAEGIAAAIACAAQSAYPTAVPRYDSPSTGPTRPRTNTSTTPTPTEGPAWDPCAVPADQLAAADLRIWREGRTCSWKGPWFDVRAPSSAPGYESALYPTGHQTYTRPEPLIVGGRSAVLLHWEQTDLFCVLAFDIAGAPHSPRMPRVIELEISSNTEDRRDELCAEVIRVGDAVAGSLPPPFAR